LIATLKFIAGHPDCTEDIALLRTALNATGQLIHVSPPVNGNRVTWKEVINKVESERTLLCKHLDCKAFLRAMLHMYTAIHKELRDSLQPEQQQNEFREGEKNKETETDPLRGAT
jgi:hypothetical protein